MSKRIVIIGGGPAGVESALAAARCGAETTIISDAPIGGRAGWHSLLPSKAWLAAADTIKRSRSLGLISEHVAGDDQLPTAVVEKIAAIKRTWNEGLDSALDIHGVDVLPGVASFVQKDKAEIHNSSGEMVSSIEADAFIVASGSVPLFPAELKPDGKQVIAPRFSSQLNSLPESIIVVGAGPTGCESAYLFNQFGVRVTWIVDQFGVLPQMHADLGRYLGKELVLQGIHMVQGQMVQRLEKNNGVTAVLMDGSRYEAEMAFVAIGRKPDLSRLNLPKAGVSIQEDGRIITDAYGRIPDRSIYLVGDAAGGELLANKAMAQARVAGRHAAGAEVGLYDPNLIVQVTYTDPQAAQIGEVRLSERTRSVRVAYGAALKAHLVDEPGGFVELFYDSEQGNICGAAAAGSHAADVLAPVAVAIKMKANLSQLAEIYAPHPSLSELVFIAARDAD